MSKLFTIQLSAFRKTSVRRELTIGFTIVIALLLLVSAAALYNKHRSAQALDRLIANDTRLAELTLRSNNHLLKARRYEKDFQLSFRHLGFTEAKARYVSFFRIQLSDIRANLREIRHLADSLDIARQTRELETVLNRYENGFLLAVDMQAAQGHFNSGLAGEMRSRARALEEQIRTLDDNRLHAAHLQMRRHEKDFMLRDMESDARALRLAAQKFDVLLLDQPSRQLRETMRALNLRYLQSFEDYAAAHARIWKTRADYLSAVHTAEPLLQNLYVAATRRVDAARQALHADAVATTRTVIAASGVAALFALAVAFVVARSVNRSVRDSMRFAEQIAGGNLDSRIIPPDQKEFAALAHALNTMADSLRDSLLAQQSRAAELERSVNERTAQLQGVNQSLTAEIETRKQTEVQLYAAKESAEAATLAKSAFLANMSHEIRTPMNGIIGLADLMMKTSMTPHQTEFMTMIRTSGHSLLRLLNDILDFSKMEARKLKLDTIEFDVRETVGDALKSLSANASEKGLELACDIAAELPQRLIGDPGRLMQVLINLIGNAIKFTHAGEVVVRVAVLSQEGSRAVLTLNVSDTGIGIARDKQHRIFEAFAQADESTTRQYGGTGLGLAIVAEMVHLMEGVITIDSTPGRGTSIRLTLPMTIAPRQPDRITMLDPSLHGRRVLVADDSRTVREILCGHLSRWGLQPIAVDDAKDARDMLQQSTEGPPDAGYAVALIDADIAGNGFDLVQFLVAHPAIRTTPAMMLSSADIASDVSRCEALGVPLFLRKPVKEAELFNTIEAALASDMPALQQARENSDAATEPVMRALHVLVAEDHPINQRLITEILKERGHTFAIANNGLEVLEMMETQRFDIVLMDGQMPEMDGYQATAEIRKREKATGVRTRIIAVTAHAMTQDRGICLSAGMDGYIAKPVDGEELLDLIEQLPARAKRDAPSVSSGADSDSYRSAMPGMQPVASSALKTFDVETALRRMRGKGELLQQMVTTFRDDLPVSMQAIKRAALQHDRDALESGAHRIKGAASALGADQLAHAAAIVEQLAKDSVFDQMPLAIARFETCADVLTNEIASRFGKFA